MDSALPVRLRRPHGDLAHRRLSANELELAGEDEEEVELLRVERVCFADGETVHSPNAVFVADWLAVLVAQNLDVLTRGLRVQTIRDAVVQAIVR